MRYMVQRYVDGEYIVSEFAQADFRSAMEALGFTPDGFTDDSAHYAEMRGQPRFKELHGPTYGGDGIARYDDWETSNFLST